MKAKNQGQHLQIAVRSFGIESLLSRTSGLGDFDALIALQPGNPSQWDSLLNKYFDTFPDGVVLQSLAHEYAASATSPGQAMFLPELPSREDNNPLNEYVFGGVCWGFYRQLSDVVSALAEAVGQVSTSLGNDSHSVYPWFATEETLPRSWEKDASLTGLKQVALWQVGGLIQAAFDLDSRMLTQHLTIIMPSNYLPLFQWAAHERGLSKVAVVTYPKE